MHWRMCEPGLNVRISICNQAVPFPVQKGTHSKC